MRLRISARTLSSIRASSADAGMAASTAIAISSAAAAAPARCVRVRPSASRISPQATPAAPSHSVIARVPMVGIRKNVVPSVPTIEPKVETP